MKSAHHVKFWKQKKQAIHIKQGFLKKEKLRSNFLNDKRYKHHNKLWILFSKRILPSQKNSTIPIDAVNSTKKKKKASGVQTKQELRVFLCSWLNILKKMKKK
jgi:hypothetical protein